MCHCLSSEGSTLWSMFNNSQILQWKWLSHFFPPKLYASFVHYSVVSLCQSFNQQLNFFWTCYESLRFRLGNSTVLLGPCEVTVVFIFLSVGGGADINSVLLGQSRLYTLSIICSFVMSVDTVLTELSLCERSFARNFPTFGTKETSQ